MARSAPNHGAGRSPVSWQTAREIEERFCFITNVATDSALCLDHRQQVLATATTDRGHGGNELHKVMACWRCTGWTSYEKREMYILNLLAVMFVEQ